jgi:hypothetical protein
MYYSFLLLSKSHTRRLAELLAILILIRSISFLHANHLLRTPGHRHSTHSVPSQAWQPSCSSPSPSTRKPLLCPFKPRKDLSRKHNRDLPHRHISDPTQIRLPIHSIAQLVQESQIESSCLLSEAFEQETIHE